MVDRTLLASKEPSQRGRVGPEIRLGLEEIASRGTERRNRRPRPNRHNEHLDQAIGDVAAQVMSVGFRRIQDLRQTRFGMMIAASNPCATFLGTVVQP